MSSPLVAESVTRRFGGLVALQQVSLRLNPGEIVGLIGPNGAGKSTLLNVVAGVMKPTHGRVKLGDTDLTGKPPHVVAAAGLVRTFQAVNLFGRLSALDNVMLGSHLRFRAGFLRSLLPLNSNRRQEREIRDRALAILEECGLREQAPAEAQALSLGHQRLLSLAIALAAEPKMLLLDEPLAGLARGDQEEVLNVIRGLVGKGLGVLLVEHNMRAVMSACGRIVVLNQGRTIAEGSPAQVASDQRVREVYLGTKREKAASP